MSTLRGYLAHKRRAWVGLQDRKARGEVSPTVLRAEVSAEGRSGVRRIRIRDHQLLSDSAVDYAGYDLGPTSPELQLGVLGSCLVHTLLIQAAATEVPLDEVRVEITGVLDPRGGEPGSEDVPVHPHEISYTVHVSSPADDATLDLLRQLLERSCPLLSLLRNPQRIRGALVRS